METKNLPNYINSEEYLIEARMASQTALLKAKETEQRMHKKLKAKRLDRSTLVFATEQYMSMLTDERNGNKSNKVD